LGPATTIVPGSIVVVGNTAFLVEEHAACAMADLPNAGEDKRRFAEAGKLEKDEQAV
jgi:hypothetical protein